MTLKTFLLATALAVTPLAIFAQTDTTSATATGAAPSAEQMQAAMTTKAGFAERAASGDMFEIQSSELALQTSQSDTVKAFA